MKLNNENMCAYIGAILCCMVIACESKASPNIMKPIVHEVGTMENLINQEQEIFLHEVFKKVMSLMLGEQLFVENDPVLGPVDYFWPKNPSQPIKSWAFFKKMKYQIATLNMKRLNQDSPWEVAVINVESFPKYKEFPESKFSGGFFDGLEIEHISNAREKDVNYPNDPSKDVFVYYFKYKKDERLTLKFVSKQSFSDLKNNYPEMFAYCQINFSK